MTLIKLVLMLDSFIVDKRAILICIILILGKPILYYIPTDMLQLCNFVFFPIYFKFHFVSHVYIQQSSSF